MFVLETFHQVNNAGMVATGEFAKTSLEKLMSVFDTNVRGMFMMTKCVLPWLLATGGNIVNVSSFTAQRPVCTIQIYTDT